MADTHELTLCIDCGGGGIKGAVYDEYGVAEGVQLRTPTPYPLPPELLVQERLRQWLSQGQRVVLSAEGGRIPPSVAGQAPPVLLLALEQFEQVFDQPAHSSANIRLRATLLGYQAAGEVLLGQQLFTATLPAPSANAAGGAAALSQATDAVGQQLIQWLQTTATAR